MNSDRRAILSLVAYGRITAGEAERLIAACSSNSGAWRLIAGCALCAGLTQLQPLAHAGLAHFIRSVIEGAIPAPGHVLAQITACIGGTL
jgi:hypothetical protein